MLMGGTMANYVHLSGARCSLDLGDGSERGEYVSQDYILNVLDRPHRAVNIMYTYYPNDKEWPARISEACADMEVSFAWDYPYDDYYPFCEGGAQFEQMRDIRRHGQEVMLTLTIDCSVGNDHLRKIASSLKPFGRMFLRINHECNGRWFTHNKRFSYEEVAAFFVRFAGIVKEEAPNVRTVFCAGLCDDTPDESGVYHIVYEDVFARAYKAADVWSADKYLSLHYTWPFDNAEVGGMDVNFSADDPKIIYTRFKRTYERLSQLFGDKPFIQAELNSDGDVKGPLHQASHVRQYYDLAKADDSKWLTGISMYQFRDRGRLGLEREDPNDRSVGIRQPLLYEYKKILTDPFFSPEMTTGEEAHFPAKLRWGASDDADGLEIPLSFEKTPEFCEVTLPKELSLIMEFRGKWFYKAGGVDVIDLMPAFFKSPLPGPAEVFLRIFATPPDGENHDDGSSRWTTEQYYTMESEPQFRIRYVTPA